MKNNPLQIPPSHREFAINHLILFGILWSLAISVGSAQEQPPAANAESPIGVAPAVSEAASQEKPTGATPEGGSQSRGPSRPGIDADGNGIVDQVEIDRMPSFLRDWLHKRDVSLRAGMTINETKAAFKAAREVPAGEIRIFALKNSQATSTTDLLLQLFTAKPFRADADELHNSVVVTGSAEQLQAVEALLLKLDVAPGELNAKPVPDGKSAAVQDASKTLEQQGAELRTDYETANRQARDLAESLRQTPDAAKKAELRTAVQRAFTLRQSLLQAELLEMQTRLLQTQHSLDMRDRIADQIVDRRVEDLLNPHLEWEQTLSRELKTQSELKAPVQPESSVAVDSSVVTELEGEWHRVAYIGKWQTERRPMNMTIRANQKTGTHWTGESVSRSVDVDASAKTIVFGAVKVKGGLPNQIVSEQGTYELTGDVLTIHSEYTCTDSASGTLISKGEHTNTWKRGLREIPDDYDSRKPSNGMGLFFLNGNDKNTGYGTLLPGTIVDVFATLTLPNGTPLQRILAESLEVDGSTEPTENRERQIRLLGTREQCLLLQNTAKHEIMSLRIRKPNDEKLQFPDGINRKAFKELDAARRNRDLEPTAE